MSTLADVVEMNGRRVLSTQADVRIIDAVEQMCDQHVRALLVGEVTDPKGIVCERDILERVILSRKDPEMMTVADAMTSPLVLLSVSCTPEDALSFMLEHRLHQIPIFSDEVVIGIVSSSDLLRWATRAQLNQIRDLNDYVAGRYPG